MSNFPYALAATIYFAILAVALLALGTHSVRSIVMVALFLGALSQYIMQGITPQAPVLSNMVAYVAMAMILFAVVLYMIP